MTWSETPFFSWLKLFQLRFILNVQMYGTYQLFPYFDNPMPIRSFRQTWMALIKDEIDVIFNLQKHACHFHDKKILINTQNYIFT